MPTTTQRLFLLAAILCSTAGCRGGGDIFRVAGALTVVAAEVAVRTAAASPPVEEGAPVVMVAAPPPCVELRPGVDAPEGARAVQCGGRVLVQDGATGQWQEVGVE